MSFFCCSRQRTSYHYIKEEPESDTGDDPLAMLPEEENRLRTASTSRLIPRVVIPPLDQSIINAFSAHSGADRNVSNTECDSHASDSEAAPSLHSHDASDVEIECDFPGFGGEFNIPLVLR